MKSEVQPEYILGTWSATSTSFKDNKQLYTNGSGDRLVRIKYDKRTNPNAPKEGLTYNGAYVSGLWYETSSAEVVKYRGDIKTMEGNRLNLSVYVSGSELTVTER